MQVKVKNKQSNTRNSVSTWISKSVEGMVDYFAGWGGEKNRDFIANDYTHELLGKYIAKSPDYCRQDSLFLRICKTPYSIFVEDYTVN